jgi:hypothetical protein
MPPSSSGLIARLAALLVSFRAARRGFRGGHIGFRWLSRYWTRLSLIAGFAAIAVGAGVASFKFRRVFFLLFEEIRDVEESVTLQSQVDKRGLHAGKNPGDTALVDGAG